MLSGSLTKTTAVVSVDCSAGNSETSAGAALSAADFEINLDDWGLGGDTVDQPFMREASKVRVPDRATLEGEWKCVSSDNMGEMFKSLQVRSHAIAPFPPRALTDLTLARQVGVLRRKLAEAASFGVGRQTQRIRLHDDGSIFISNTVAGVFSSEMTVLPDGVQREVTNQAAFGKKTVLVQVCTFTAPVPACSSIVTRTPPTG